MIPLYSTLDEGGVATYQVHVTYPNAENSLVPITIIISPNVVDPSGVYTSLGDFTLTFTGVDSTQTFSIPVPENSAWQPANHLAVLALPTRDVIGLFSGSMDDVQSTSALITENDESLAPTSEEEYLAAMTQAYEANASAGYQSFLTYVSYYDTGSPYSSQLSVADVILYVNNFWSFAPFDESAYYLTLPDTHFNPNWSLEMTSPPTITPPSITPPTETSPSNSGSSNSSPPSPDTTVIPPTNSGSNNSSPPTPDPLISAPPASGSSYSGSPPTSGNSSSSSGSNTSSTSGSSTTSSSSSSSSSPPTGDLLTSGIWSSMNSGSSSSTNPLLV